MVGLLAERSYMMKVNAFSGVKMAHLLPLVGLAVAMAAGLPMRDRPFSRAKADVMDNVRRILADPVFVWQLAAGFLALGVVGFALMRTGNDPGVGVSGLELQFRDVMDKLMMVRPRTKEFMIGHPAFFAGIALLLANRRRWGLPLLAFGLIGQVSMVNTFCHIHTPLAVSVMRAANGLILGLLAGIVVWLLVRRRVSADTRSGV